jgi:hypothetical protein
MGLKSSNLKGESPEPAAILEARGVDLATSRQRKVGLVICGSGWSVSLAALLQGRPSRGRPCVALRGDPASHRVAPCRVVSCAVCESCPAVRFA